MATLTISLSDDTTISPAAGGKIVVRSPRSTAVVKPPSGSVRFTTGERMSHLSFGVANGRVVVSISGPADDLRQIFTHVCGVDV